MDEERWRLDADLARGGSNAPETMHRICCRDPPVPSCSVDVVAGFEAWPWPEGDTMLA